DPPINIARVVKRGDRMRLADLVDWTPPARDAALPDGAYTLRLRPHHVLPAALAADGPDRGRVPGKVRIDEISGSESVAHFMLGDQPWVSIAHGVHQLAVGEPALFDLDVAQALYFDADERLVEAGAAARTGGG